MTPVYLSVNIVSEVFSIRRLSISKRTRLNQEIRAQNLRVIDSNGDQIGVLSREEALRAAYDQDLDLVEISPNANPPVAKIVDWGKYNYQKTKQLQKTKRSAKSPELKQMRFGLKIGDHDLGVKLNKVESFLAAGHKVKLIIFYRGREMAHKDIGFQLAGKILEILAEKVIVEQQPQLSGRQLTLVIRANSSAKLSQKNEADVLKNNVTKQDQEES